MKIKTQFLPKLGYIALSVGISTIAMALSSAILPQSATAQSADRVKPLEDINNRQNEQDSLTGTGGLSVLDLINRSQLSVDSQGFSDTVDRNLDQATMEFRRQQLESLKNQLESLKNQQQVSPTTPPPTSGTTN